MAEDGNSEQNGVPITGTTFDQELYGASDRYAGFDTSIGLDVGDEQDERERALAKCVTKHQGKRCSILDACSNVLCRRAVRCSPLRLQRSSSKSFQTTKVVRYV